MALATLVFIHSTVFEDINHSCNQIIINYTWCLFAELLIDITHRLRHLPRAHLWRKPAAGNSIIHWHLLAYTFVLNTRSTCWFRYRSDERVNMRCYSNKDSSPSHVPNYRLHIIAATLLLPQLLIRYGVVSRRNHYCIRIIWFLPVTTDALQYFAILSDTNIGFGDYCIRLIIFLRDSIHACGNFCLGSFW